MRLIGLAEYALKLACERALDRVAFGKPIANLGGNRERIADARIAIEAARLLVLKTAWLLDTGGPMAALSEVSQIKVLVPKMAQDVIDMAIQIHGGAGLSDDTALSGAWTMARALRLADGPDEVHRGVVARHRAEPVQAGHRDERRRDRRRPIDEPKDVRADDAIDADGGRRLARRAGARPDRRPRGQAVLRRRVEPDLPAPLPGPGPDPAAAAGGHQGEVARTTCAASTASSRC